MPQLLWILIATFSISLIAIIAIFGLYIKEKLLRKLLLELIGLSAGALMGGAFLHLIPEAVEKTEGIMPYVLVIVGFIAFFGIERILHWRHCHEGVCETHSFGYLNLIGDSIHNFMDGIIIAGAFLADFRLGVITTFAVALHEIPQEIGDFGVLIYAGFKKLKALLLNYAVASTVILGGLFGYFASGATSIVPYILPLAAGGFLYISASDLLPEIKKQPKSLKFIPPFITFLIGITLMLLLKIFVEA